MKVFFSIICALSFCMLSAQITQFPWEPFSNINNFPQGWRGNGWEFHPDEGYGLSYQVSTNSNNMLATPQLKLPNTPSGQAMFLSASIFDYYTDEGKITAKYEILVLTTGSSDSYFKPIYSGNTQNDDIISINLSEYEGQNIYLAFRKTEGNNVTIGYLRIANPYQITTFPFNSSHYDVATTLADVPLGWDNINGMLVTPLLQIPTPPPGKEYTLRYVVTNKDSESTVDYEVLVSSTSNTSENFLKLVGEETIEQLRWGPSRHTVSLRQYEGQNIRLALKLIGSPKQVEYSISIDIKTNYVDEFPWEKEFSIEDSNDLGWITNEWSNFGEYMYNEGEEKTLLISPQLRLPQNKTLNLEFSGYGNMEVLVSATGTATSNFERIYIGQITGEITPKISLAKYAGQRVYIAFRGGSNFYGIKVKP